MPTPHKLLEKQKKHLTKAERASRSAAEQELERGTRVSLRMPEWLSEDARKIWADVRRKQKAIQLLDNLDAELLGIYCDALSHYRAATKILRSVDENGRSLSTDDRIKQAQAWARIVSTFAEKLGLSPAARARLARKKAVPEPTDDLEDLLNDVSDFVNQDQRGKHYD